MLCRINLPDWIQAICAIATLWFAWIVSKQQDKIKTLTDVVNSLNEQAKTWQELLEFEMRSRINDVQPNFITLTNLFNINHYTFSFKNIGQRARTVSFEKIQNMATLNIDNPRDKLIPTNDAVLGNYTLIENNSPFSFKINYEDNNGNIFFQIVNGASNKKLRISLPKRYIEEAIG